MRFYTLIVSIGAHVAALTVLIVVPLAAMDALPIAREAAVFVRASAAKLPDVPPPPRRGHPQVDRDVSASPIPTHAPHRIDPEVVPPGIVPFDGPDGVPDGVEGGVPLLNFVAPPVPPPAQREPVRPGGNIRPPAKIRHVAPVYPPLAQSVRREGVVILEAVINEEGEVRQLRVLRSVPLLDEAAMDAVRQWRFTPTLLNGQAVPIVMTVTVSFQLK
jgi:periplasmic protein TonB